MIKNIKIKMMAAQAAFVVGMMADSANAAGTVQGNNWSTVSQNIAGSMEELPGLIASISYLVGMLMGVLGVVKIKDHVENPTQTPMREGAVRLAAGGALFALPMMFEAMQNTIGTTTVQVGPAQLNRATFSLNN
ncbi:MAG: hypothetical protein KTR28_04750 [Micavibrio sp.]|nr:hypothetical protein [Micavibrio sp.]